MIKKLIDRLKQMDRLLTIKAIVSVLILYFLAPSLLPDEAQYWVWSQHFDIGYYSKPPGIAWLLAISTAILGKSAWSVRLPSILLSWLGAYYLARGLRGLGFSHNRARISMYLFAFCPLILYGSLAATTDVGLLTAWCAILCFLVEPVDGHRKYRLAFASFLGMLFKPSVIILAPLQLIRSKKLQEKNTRLADALAITVGCLFGAALPFLWNMEHGWPTFRHISTQILVGSSPSIFSWTRPWGWIACQMLLLSPWAASHIFRGLINLRIRSALFSTRAHGWIIFYGSIGSIIILWGMVASFWTKYQANWAVISYPFLFYVLAWHLAQRPEKSMRRWVYGHTILHSLLLVIALYISNAQVHPQWPFSTLPWRYNLFRSAMGWSLVDDYVQTLAKNPSQQFLISDKYQTVSLLNFHSSPRSVYWFNLHGARRNQFSFWPVPDIWKGKGALFIAVEDETVEEMQKMSSMYIDRLRPYFSHIKSFGVAPLVPGRNVKSLLWIQAEGYLGGRPQDPEQY